MMALQKPGGSGGSSWGRLLNTRTNTPPSTSSPAKAPWEKRASSASRSLLPPPLLPEVGLLAVGMAAAAKLALLLLPAAPAEWERGVGPVPKRSSKASAVAVEAPWAGAGACVSAAWWSSCGPAADDLARNDSSSSRMAPFQIT